MKLPFDKCYCLHLTEATDRYDHIISEFEKLGIEDQVEIWWSVKRPISTQIGNYLESLHTADYDKFLYFNKDLYGAIFNVSFEFYTIIKSAYLRGYNSILLMEDDITFDKTIEEYESIFNNILDDYDILRLGYSPYHNDWISKEQIYKINSNLFLKTNWHFGGMCLTAFSRNGMKYYIDFMDKHFKFADAPIYFNYPSYLNNYVARQSIVNVYGYGSIINTNKNINT